MENSPAPYVTACPVGCSAALVDSAWRVREGLLRRCAGCGQLLSRASEARYNETMAQFNAGEFNLTTGGALQRRNAVALRRLERIASLLGKPLQDIRLCDIGCSRGQFVAAAITAGCHAEGIETRAADRAGCA